MARFALLLVALVLVAAGCFGGGSSSPQTAGPCAASQLKVTLVRSVVAAGNVGGYIGFTNQAATRCVLRGWPRVVALSATVSTTAEHVRSTMFGPRPNLVGVPAVTLGPGQRGDAVVAGSDIPLGETSCPSPYRQLRVTPPRGDRSVLVSSWLPSLDAYLPACSQIVVTMVVPASALYRG